MTLVSSVKILIVDSSYDNASNYLLYWESAQLVFLHLFCFFFLIKKLLDLFLLRVCYVEFIFK